MKHQTITKVLKSSKDTLESLAGVLVDDTRLGHIVKVFTRIMGIKSQLKAGMVYQSCLHLIDTVPDEVTITETFRKILANDQYIWNDMSIPVWRGEPVNVTIGIVRAQEKPNKHGSSTLIYFRVLSGLPAGMLLSMSIPSWWVCKVIKRKLGLFRSGITVSPMDISGTSFQVTLSSDTKSNKITWTDVSATQAQKKQNKEVIYARYNDRPCGGPEPCCKCRATRRQCPLAVL